MPPKSLMKGAPAGGSSQGITAKRLQRRTGLDQRPALGCTPTTSGPRTSAAGGDVFLEALRQCSPRDTFARAPVAPRPREPVFVPLSFHQAICKRLGEAINAHNRAYAQAQPAGCA